MKNIIQSINLGTEYLLKTQQQAPFFNFQTLFPTLLIGECLNHVTTPQSLLLRNNIFPRVMKQKSPYWTFNYWLRNSPNYYQEPYPDDLDDTFCCLSFIHNYQPQLITGEVLAKTAQVLIHCEHNPGGPYSSWLTDPHDTQWNDTDIAVNSNIAYFLSLQHIALPRLQTYIDDQIKSNQLLSPYYKGELPIIYFLSRFYNGPYKQLLIDKLLHNSQNSALALSLKISALCRLNPTMPLKDYVNVLLNKQLSSSGAWPSADLYVYNDARTDRKYIGSSALTTAFALEALFLCSQHCNLHKVYSHNSEASVVSQIKSRVFSEISSFPLQVRQESKLQALRVFEIDKRSDYLITLSPARIQAALKSSYRSKINSDLLIDLGLLNYYGWLSYTLYDDIQDRDQALELVSIANLFHRRLINVLEILVSTLGASYQEFYNHTLDVMDAAIFADIKSYSFSSNNLASLSYSDDYTSLANKSLGHMLAPITLLLLAGIDINSPQTNHMINFFRYFLTAKQMNDDAHDWEADYKNGYANSAFLEILFRHTCDSVPVWDMKTMQKTFWVEVLPIYGSKIINYLELARNEIHKVNVIEDDTIFENMLQPLFAATEQALTQRQTTLDFLGNYQVKYLKQHNNLLRDKPLQKQRVRKKLPQ